MTTKHQILKDVFGHGQFRDGQEALVDAVLVGRDVLGVMPTGAGKSICYQVPALMLSGVTLVVSPLISLMKDQTGALKLNGVPAAYLNSSLSERQYALALERAAAGAYKLIYVAPERLNTNSFRQLCQTLDISLLAVDEAHCVSQWGQDFRPSYTEIPRFLETLKVRPPVAAFTATATPRVREDVVDILGLRDPLVKVTGFDRKNLYFEVRRPKKKAEELIAVLRGKKDQSGIVYCSTRKAVEEVTEKLRGAGFSVARYHAGLSDEERHSNQEDFLYDRVSVMVATNAFGMGIDKSNVSFVVHYNMPKDLESYYQEAGRAGRDGSDACCILLYGGQDLATARFLIEHKDARMYASPEAEAFLKEQERRRLKVMEGYCKTDGCLRAYILTYFGEPRPESCGHCGNCDSESEQTDVTQAAKAVLRCVAECGERFGKTTVVEVLRGSRAEKVVRCGLDRLAAYGVCKQPASTLREIADLLLAEGYLEQTDGEYPVLKKGDRFDEGVSEEARIFIRRMRHKEETSSAARYSDPASQALFARLKTLRARLAKETGVPAYVIFHDSTLLGMSAARPADESALLRVSGVGRAKAERYGAAFLTCIADFMRERGESAQGAAASGAHTADALVPAARMETQEQPIVVSQIADRLSVASLQAGGKKISAKQVNDFLTEKGLLDWVAAQGGRRRTVTEQGRAVGIFTEQRFSAMPYEVILFGREAQEYIAERMQELFRFCGQLR